jgi:hypothetical protein
LARHNSDGCGLRRRPQDAGRPDVSIIIPCYNAATTVVETLASVQAQTHENWQAVCVDDESTDRTPELLHAVSGEDARICPLRVPHGGLASARNRGLTAAIAERVLFLDADDVLRPDALATLLRAASQLDEHTVISGGFELLTEQGRPLPACVFRPLPDNSFDAFLRGNRISVVALVPRVLLGPRAFDESLPACEDWDLWLRLCDAGVSIASVPRVLFGYRLRGGSLSGRADLMHAAGRRVLDRWLPRARRHTQVRDVRHLWAAQCGAQALAAGQPEAIGDYFADLEPLVPTDGFAAVVAHGIHAAYRAIHGASGALWRDHADRWLAEIDAWLPAGPLAACADAIAAHLAAAVVDTDGRLDVLRALLERRPDAQRLVVYGLGQNGLLLLERLRDQSWLRSRELQVADDYADALTVDLIGRPRVWPSRWTEWPAETVAVITPDVPAPQRAVLIGAGGREGTDFVVLAGDGVVAASASS